MPPYNTYLVSDTSNNDVLNFYNEVYDNINKYNLDKENAISNIYMYKKTKMINKIFYIIILICVIIILLTFINKTFKYFDDVAYLIICGILIAIAILYIGYILFDLYFRSKLNFDEYDYNSFGTNNPSKMLPDMSKDYSDISGANVKCGSSIEDKINKSFFKQLF
jgi:hypothetical protein